MNEVAVKPVRVVIVGCGRVCRYHLNGIANNPAFDVVGICDIDPESASWAEDAFQTKRQDFENIQNIEPDLAVICTPSGHHFHHAHEMLNSGIHVLIEKPATLNANELEELVSLAERKNRQIFVVQQQRFLDSVQHLKDNLESLGEVFAIQMHLFWARPQSYFEQNEWRGTKKLDGGVLYNQGAHSIDLLSWLFGYPLKITGTMKTLKRNIEFEDTIACTIEFENGGLATFTSTILCPERNFEAGITIIAENGIVRLGGISFEKMEVWEVKGTDAKTYSDRATDYVYKDGHLKTYIEVAKALRREPHQAVDGNEALKTIRFIEAIYDACSIGETP